MTPSPATTRSREPAVAVVAGTTAAIYYDTIAGNQASAGGGLDIPIPVSPISGNIVASNTPVNCSSSYEFNKDLTRGNLEDDPEGSCFTASGDNLIGQDPKLGPLAYSGGATKTMALMPGSPAIGFDGRSTLITVDQRGFQRTPGSRSVSDLGAWDSGGVHATAHQLIVNELRLGPSSGTNDGYVDVYNPSGSPVATAGWWLGYQNASGNPQGVSLPDTTVPAGGHLLIGPSDFTLGSYATPDLTAGLGLSTGTGVKLEAQDDTITDQVGPSGSDYHAGTPLPRASLGTSDAAFVRRYSGGVPVDTDNNASDFSLVATDAATNAHGSGAVLGTPGPLALSSPTQQNAVARSYLLDSGTSASAAPNRVYDPATGLLTVRRAIINTSRTQTINALRLRLTSITTYGNTTSSQAILTVRSSHDETVDGKPIEGLALDKPPVQDLSGGGLNSSLTVPLPRGGLAPGEAVNVDLLFHVERGGSFSFGYNAEATTS
jgi:hypothetical protein